MDRLKPRKASSTRFPHMDFPAEALKGSVALLRSKFCSSNTTDTGQIFGATRRVSRSKTFHSTNERPSPSQSIKYNSSPAHRILSAPKGKQLSQNSGQIELTISSQVCSENHPRSTSSAAPTAYIQEERPQFLALSVPATDQTSVLRPSKPLNRSVTVHVPVSSGASASAARLQDQRVHTSVDQGVYTAAHSGAPKTPLTTPAVPRRHQELASSPSIRSTSPPHHSAPPPSGHTDCGTEAIQVSATSSTTMANAALVAQYSHIDNLDELNAKLKETRDFEQRRAIRSAIRTLREKNITSSGNHTRSPRISKDTPDVSDGEVTTPALDLSGYTVEEDLKILLHQTTKYEDKKRIRAAIRDLRKKTDKQSDTLSANSAASPSSSIASARNEGTPTSSPRSSAVTCEESPYQPPTTPGVMTLLKETDLSKSTCQDDNASDTLVSPVKHESRVLPRSDGDIKIESYSKHSRTTSQSDVYEKSTKVTQISRVGDLEISEQDEIITKEKLSQKGSVSTESGLIRKVDIKERNGVVLTEEDISIERVSQSRSTGQETQSALQVSIVREKYPPVVLKGLSDASGVDGQPLTLTCEFEVRGLGSDDVHVVWLKDGEVVKCGKDLVQTWECPVAKLNITELLYPDDSGCYVCRAENAYGAVETSATLTVSEPPQESLLEFSQELTDVTVQDGDADVRLICRLSECDDTANVSWYKDGKALKNNQEFKQAFDGLTASLVISEVFPEDSGEYECCAVRGSKELSSYAKVQVQEAVDIKSTAAENGVICAAREDTNNNTSDEPTKAEQVDDIIENGGEKATPTDNGKVEENNIDIEKTSEDPVGKCEKILEAATITEGEANGEKAHDSTDSQAKETLSKTPTAPDSAPSKPASAVQPALKSIPKKIGMSQPATGKSAPASARGAMAAFKQMDTANNPSGGSSPRPNSAVSINSIPAAKHAAKMIKRRAMGIVEIKQEMLTFCRANTADYENVKIENFSTSWNNGVAFLALIHHFYPDSFVWEKVDERRRKENFQLAFDLAEKKADIAPLLDVEDMVRMKKPDWKCVFTYIQSFYRKLRDHENNKHTYLQQ